MNKEYFHIMLKRGALAILGFAGLVVGRSPGANVPTTHPAPADLNVPRTTAMPADQIHPKTQADDPAPASSAAASEVVQAPTTAPSQETGVPADVESPVKEVVPPSSSATPSTVDGTETPPAKATGLAVDVQPKDKAPKAPPAVPESTSAAKVAEAKQQLEQQAESVTIKKAAQTASDEGTTPEAVKKSADAAVITVVKQAKSVEHAKAAVEKAKAAIASAEEAVKESETAQHGAEKDAVQKLAAAKLAEQAANAAEASGAHAAVTAKKARETVEKLANPETNSMHYLATAGLISSFVVMFSPLKFFFEMVGRGGRWVHQVYCGAPCSYVLVL